MDGMCPAMLATGCDPSLPRTLVHQRRTRRAGAGPEGPRDRVGLDRLLRPLASGAGKRAAAGPGLGLRRRDRPRLAADHRTAGGALPRAAAVSEGPRTARGTGRLRRVVPARLETTAERDRANSGPARDQSAPDRRAGRADERLAGLVRADARRARLPLRR